MEHLAQPAMTIVEIIAARPQSWKLDRGPCSRAGCVARHWLDGADVVTRNGKGAIPGQLVPGAVTDTAITDSVNWLQCHEPDDHCLCSSMREGSRDE
jgi:hypothetical protein